jgi:hypothetical protein
MMSCRPGSEDFVDATLVFNGDVYALGPAPYCGVVYACVADLVAIEMRISVVV